MNYDNGWVGIDLDNTLAYYISGQEIFHIGEPIPLMLERTLKWLAEGKALKIFTARVSSNNPNREQERLGIQKWCLQHLGQILEVTAEKDFDMITCWDDRCTQVIPDMGIALQDLIED